MSPAMDQRTGGGDAGSPTGILLLRGRLGLVARWARAGVVPVRLAPLEGWTVLAASGPSRASPPYHDATALLAGRPVPARLGPALGFFVIDGRGVVTVHDRSPRRRVRWVVWDPELGVLRPSGLEVAPPPAVLRAAGGGSRADVVEVLSERHLQPSRLLAALVAVLGLPGPRLLIDPAALATLPGVVEREPEDRQVSWFEDAVRDSVLLRRELERS